MIVKVARLLNTFSNDLNYAASLEVDSNFRKVLMDS
jgi:hypothetical protein